MGTKVILNSTSSYRVSINNQQTKTIRTVGITPSVADISVALQVASQAFDKANNAVSKAGDTLTGPLTFSTANGVINFFDGTTQNTAFSSTLDGGLF